LPDDATDVLACLEQRVRRGHQQWRNPVDRSAEPGLGQVAHPDMIPARVAAAPENNETIGAVSARL
jgi:hypothetical protein